MNIEETKEEQSCRMSCRFKANVQQRALPP